MHQRTPKKLSSFELHKMITANSEGIVIIDVREEQELKLASLKLPFLHLPLSQASIWSKNYHEKIPHNKSIVVVCHAGIRSWSFGQWLIDQGWLEDIWNLEGGIDAWSVDIDETIPRY
tara:strand:- start:234 stop:587 length:354 start_codon:yes stop_codon:yes gene_type:complete